MNEEKQPSDANQIMEVGIKTFSNERMLEEFVLPADLPYRMALRSSLRQKEMIKEGI